MDFIFQGFQSTLPFWLYLLIFAACSFLAWWSYSSIAGLRKSFRYLLITLRTAVFFILLLLLLNPFFKTETAYFKKPSIVVMLDNSASTSLEKSNYQGLKSYQEVLDELNLNDSSSISFDFFSIGKETQQKVPDELTFGAGQTNLASAIQQLKGNQNVNAAIILSDGIYTEGTNPVFEVSDVNFPVFTIGLGDTTTQKDVLVSSITANSTGYLNSRQAVTATVSSKGFKGESFQVRLQKGSEVISSKTVTPDISNHTQSVNFELLLEEEGLQQYKVMIPKLAGEWSGENNSQLFSVDVKDAKQQILSLAFEVHPDVRFVRSLLLTDQNINLTSRTWLNGNRFIEGPLSINPDTVDLVIFHGYPRSGVSQNLGKTVKMLAEEVPFIMAAAPLFSAQDFEQEIYSLPMSVSEPMNYSPVSINPEVEPTQHPVMELPAITFDEVPLLSAPVQNLNLVPGATMLLSSSFQDSPTQKPVLAVQELGNKRVAVFTAFGWFRLGQTTNTQVQDFVRQLWLNVVSWTATGPNNQNLEVQPEQNSFSGGDPVIINAYLKNERGEVESDAAIDISVSSDSMETKFYSMENKGSGQYQLDLGTMPEGIYSFEATAKKGSRVIESREGEFAVAKVNAEFINTKRNEQLLRQIATRTGGEYVPFDSVSEFWNRLGEQGLLDQTEQTETTFFYPYQHILWFILVLALLSAEWILRKYYALP